MPPSPTDHAIARALKSFIESSGLVGQAILIGGQAIRDWHAEQAYHLTGSEFPIPLPRSTTDVDIHVVVDAESREDLTRVIEAEWEEDVTQAGTHVYRFHFRTDASVTLDLIGQTHPTMNARTQFLARVSEGGPGRDIGATRVLAPWILACELHERCFTREFALLHIRRLTRLGLIASKMTAAGNTLAELDRAHREKRPPAEWTRGRLSKDLQDLALLLWQRIWTAVVWEPHYRAYTTVIHNAWAGAREAVMLRERPEYVTLEDYQLLCDHILPYLPARLDERTRSR